MIVFSFISTASATFIWDVTFQNYKKAANFLADNSVINDHEWEEEKYNLAYTITRREMLKVMMNISGKEVPQTCEGRFSDLSGTDWGCKYAEAALSEWYIAENATFRPDDNVTKIEALKMIMQSKWVERNEADDWREGYTSKATEEWFLDSAFSDFDTVSIRGWIFYTGSKTYDDTPTYEEETESWLTPEEEELLNHWLNV